MPLSTLALPQDLVCAALVIISRRRHALRLPCLLTADRAYRLTFDFDVSAHQQRTQHMSILEFFH